MDKQAALDLINTLEIVDYDADGEGLYYANVEVDNKARDVLRKLGKTDEWIDLHTDADGLLDLTHFVWEYARWFDGEKFLTYEPGDHPAHYLKTWPEYFEAVQSGRKTFEIRRNDRDYQVGDTLVLVEWCPIKKAYTGQTIEKTITYITNFAQVEDYVVMGIADLARKGKS